jgi:ATP-dependent DNA helicase PIF1
MLRRNINTKAGLVNGALGTVLSIDPNAIRVQFDHITDPYCVETVKSRFFLMKNFCIYRRQFPLILAYAVTIYKCQGLSLDTAILDLSEHVFCAGMAYVALSRVRTLDGLYLLKFSPKAIIVSTKCIEEVNRLRAAYRSDLPLLDVPAGSAPRKRMFQGSVHDLPPLKKQPVN